MNLWNWLSVSRLFHSFIVNWDLLLKLKVQDVHIHCLYCGFLFISKSFTDVYSELVSLFLYFFSPCWTKALFVVLHLNFRVSAGIQLFSIFFDQKKMLFSMFTGQQPITYKLGKVFWVFGIRFFNKYIACGRHF